MIQVISLSSSSRKKSTSKLGNKAKKYTLDRDKPVKFSSTKKLKKDSPFGLHIRTSPSTMVDALQSLTDDQKESVKEMGFGSMLTMKLTNIPAKLAHFLVQNFDDERLILRIGGAEIKITAELVQDM